MVSNAVTSLQDQIRDRYDSFEHHTISYHILVNNEGQEPERSFDVWASRAEIEAFARDGYLVREALIEGEPLEMLRRALDEVEEAEFEEADGSRLRGRDWIPRHLFDKHADFHILINFDPAALAGACGAGSVCAHSPAGGAHQLPRAGGPVYALASPSAGDDGAGPAFFSRIRTSWTV